MQRYRQPAGVIVIAAMLCASTGWVGAQIPKTLMEFGQPTYPAYEGWYPNEDGSFSLLVGYFNPNGDQSLDVPIGGGNYLSPGPQDQGQPTHISSWTAVGSVHNSSTRRFR